MTKTNTKMGSAKHAAALALALLGLPVGAADKASPQGFLHGTVEVAGGREYTGLLRWGTEETFWDDLFNGTKTDLPYLKEYGRDEQRRSRIEIFGVNVGYRWDSQAASRMFIARFGDVRSIEVQRGQKIGITMKDGETYELDGGSNDIGATVAVIDDSLGQIDLEWGKIRKISFAPAPSGTQPPARRLHGRVTTKKGEFEGFIQWDSQECLSTDKLDGESEDGNLSIEMGKIKAIEKRNSRGSRVELRDGRELVLEGTNDVDDSLRGIFVEDPRYGRVLVSWDAFERVDFDERGERSGRGYDEYGAAKRLRGTVGSRNGGSHSGELVFDLDERADWEILNGDRDGIEYNIPLRMVRRIEPQSGSASKIVLKNGEELLLSGGQDVSDNNAGVVIIPAGGKATFLKWDEIGRVEFD